MSELLEAPNVENKKPVFSFSTLMESCHFCRYDVPTISLIICVVLITLLQNMQHAHHAGFIWIRTQMPCLFVHQRCALNQATIL